MLENIFFVSYIENTNISFSGSLAYFGPTSEETLMSNVDQNSHCAFSHIFPLSSSHFTRFISRCFQFSSTYSTSFISRVNENSPLSYKHTVALKRLAKIESWRQRRRRRQGKTFIYLLSVLMFGWCEARTPTTKQYESKAVRHIPFLHPMLMLFSFCISL